MSKIFYVADLHFGHANVIKYDRRPFRDIAEMRERLISIWNERVSDDDEVYILGDFAGRREDRDALLASLNGAKHFVYGNHDAPISVVHGGKDPRHVMSARDSAEINDNGRFVVLSHYPMWVWNRSFHGSIHLYGHVHANTPEALELNAALAALREAGSGRRMYNVGVMMPYMAWGPRTLDEILAACE